MIVIDNITKSTDVELIDISPLISSSLTVWPGDLAFKRSVNMNLANGDNINLSSINTTVHLGAHTDAPIHYVHGGKGIDEIDLRFYYGKCQVIEVDIERNLPISTQHLDSIIEAPRILFKTSSWPNHNEFNKDFNFLCVELIDFLYSKYVVLIGLDSPSVDKYDDIDLPCHKQMYKYRMANLEGLTLKDVLPGIYTLSAFPLNLSGSDASPVRAVLIR